jgi:hypothetical protein
MPLNDHVDNLSFYYFIIISTPESYRGALTDVMQQVSQMGIPSAFPCHSNPF